MCECSVNSFTWCCVNVFSIVRGIGDATTVFQENLIFLVYQPPRCCIARPSREAKGQGEEETW